MGVLALLGMLAVRPLRIRHCQTHRRPPLVPRPGAYDLTMLETMDDAFPPKRTTSNIYRDNRYDQGGTSTGRDKGPMEFGGTGDSLDLLAGGATERQMLSRSVLLLDFLIAV